MLLASTVLLTSRPCPLAYKLDSYCNSTRPLQIHDRLSTHLTQPNTKTQHVVLRYALSTALSQDRPSREHLSRQQHSDGCNRAVTSNPVRETSTLDDNALRSPIRWAGSRHATVARLYDASMDNTTRQVLCTATCSSTRESWSQVRRFDMVTLKTKSIFGA
jgi:hypothetical protein